MIIKKHMIAVLLNYIISQHDTLKNLYLSFLSLHIKTHTRFTIQVLLVKQ